MRIFDPHNNCLRKAGASPALPAKDRTIKSDGRKNHHIFVEIIFESDQNGTPKKPKLVQSVSLGHSTASRRGT